MIWNSQNNVSCVTLVNAKYCTARWQLLSLQREEPDDTKPSADIQREYCYGYLYSPSVGAVTKYSCKSVGKCRYCWVIRILDNLVPVCSNGCQVKRILLLQNSHYHYLNEEVPHKTPLHKSACKYVIMLWKQHAVKNKIKLGNKCDQNVVN
jgi:hypothetical protein